MEIHERIKARREELGLSVIDLAERLNVSRATVYRYESAEILNMGIDKIEPLAIALDTTPAYLMGWDEEEPAAPSKPAGLQIRVYGTIPAGTPMEAIEDYLDIEEVPADWAKGGKEYFALQIKGDSMAPTYQDKDVIIFLKQDTCDSGQDCCVIVNGSDATFKRVFRSEKGVTLQPLNPEYEVKVYTNEDIEELPVRIIGVVFELRRKIVR